MQLYKVKHRKNAYFTIFIFIFCSYVKKFLWVFWIKHLGQHSLGKVTWTDYCRWVSVGVAQPLKRKPGCDFCSNGEKKHNFLHMCPICFTAWQFSVGRHVRRIRRKFFQDDFYVTARWPRWMRCMCASVTMIPTFLRNEVGDPWPSLSLLCFLFCLLPQRVVGAVVCSVVGEISCPHLTRQEKKFSRYQQKKKKHPTLVLFLTRRFSAAVILVVCPPCDIASSWPICMCVRFRARVQKRHSAPPPWPEYCLQSASF